MSKVKLTLEHFEYGNALLVIQVADASYKISASYLSPNGSNESLEDLAHLGVSAKRGAPMEIWFEAEPAQIRLAVTPSPGAPGTVDVVVHQFRDRVTRQPSQLGHPNFAAYCDGAEFARAVRNLFSAWKNSQEDYKARWWHAFPARAFGLLEQALAS